jgi:hypothetical protein
VIRRKRVVVNQARETEFPLKATKTRGECKAGGGGGGREHPGGEKHYRPPLKIPGGRFNI